MIQRHTMLSSKLLLLIPCLCFGVILNRWESNDKPSTKDLKLQLTNLQRQLKDFESLKEDYVRDKIEEVWGNQHLSELKDRRATLSDSLAHMSEAFKHSAGALKDSNKHMSDYVSSIMQHNSEMREQDVKIVHQLEEQSAKVHEQVDHELEEHAVLKEILDEMRHLLDVQKSNDATREGLRGTSK